MVGLIIGIISWAFPRWWSRPKLKILADRPLKSGTLITHTLIVKNTGRSAAINCIGSITIGNVTVDDLVTELPSELKKYGEALTEALPKTAGPIRYHLTKETFREVRDEKLCWSDIGNPGRININPGLVSGLDVYRVKPDEKHLYFPSDGGWQNIKMVLKSKKYEGELIVSAENAAPVKRRFTLIPTEKDVIIELD